MTRVAGRIRTTLAVALFATIGPRASAQQGIPFGTGVVLNYVMHNIDTPDWQFYTTILSITPDETVYGEDAGFVTPEGKQIRRAYRRTVSRRELAGAKGIDNGPSCNLADTVDTEHRGSVLRMASQRVFRQIKTTGSAELSAFYDYNCSRVFTATGTVSRVEPGPVKVSILLNGQRLDLSTIHVRGTLGLMDDEQDAQFWFLDDSLHPWMIREQTRWKGKEYMQQLGTVLFPDPETEKRIEQQLDKSCRAPVYGIYFQTASAELNAASRPTLAQIAGIMQRHPAWTLTIEGHTDSIGGAASNLDLSNRRAAAVRTELTGRYSVAPARLVTKGFGLGKPVESNTTIEGRARNRRVELVRACG